MRFLPQLNWFRFGLDQRKRKSKARQRKAIYRYSKRKRDEIKKSKWKQHSFANKLKNVWADHIESCFYKKYSMRVISKKKYLYDAWEYYLRDHCIYTYIVIAVIEVNKRDNSKAEE